MYADAENNRMDIQVSNDNNDSSKPGSIENTKNIHVCNTSEIFNNDEDINPDKVNDLVEFEQVLSEYTKQQRNLDSNTETTPLYSKKYSIVTDTIIEMGIDIAEAVDNPNNCDTREIDVNSDVVCANKFVKHDRDENLPINNTHDNIIIEETLQFIKTGKGTDFLISNDKIIDEADKDLNLNALPNILVSSNENKSIEIEIDIMNETSDDRLLNNSIFEDFPEAGPSELNYTSLKKDIFDLCESSSIINLTDSSNNTILEIEIADINGKTGHTLTNDVSNLVDTLDVGNVHESYVSDNESDCSFRSSDFELITEDEARMDGLIINFRQQNEMIDEHAHDNKNIIDMCLPGSSNDYAYRENHRVPEGDEFYNMFHGIYAPAYIPDLIFLENKSVVPSQCMNVERDKLGFDFVALSKEDVNEEYKDEANETAKKILDSYENNETAEKRRRRRPL